MNRYHKANQKGWDVISPFWQAGIDREGKWKRCVRRPLLVFAREEMAALGRVRGKKVCVLGSGDNLAVFALAGMGARVTSVDISGVQLAIAAERAEALGLKIEFVRADVTDLKALQNGSFDLVYTGGHVAVWVSDLKRYYREAVRILKKGGRMVVDEYHPFRRHWQWGKKRLMLHEPYLDRGPYRYDRGGEVPGKRRSLPSYEFNWTLSDFLNALIEAGLTVTDVREYGDGREGFESVTDLRGLPLHLLITGRKQ